MPYIDRTLPFHEPLTYKKIAEHPRPLCYMPCRPDVLIKRMSPGVSDRSFLFYSAMTNGWREFGSFDGINIPNFLTIQVKGRNMIQGVTTERDLVVLKDMILGENLEHVSDEVIGSSPFQKALKSLFTGLTNYGRFRLENGGWVVTDQKPEQYVWGITKKNKTPALYFVDFDSLGGIFNPELPKSHPDLIHSYITGVDTMAKFAEDMFYINLEKEKAEMAKIKGEARVLHFN